MFRHILVLSARIAPESRMVRGLGASQTTIAGPFVAARVHRDGGFIRRYWA